MFKFILQNSSYMSFIWAPTTPIPIGCLKKLPGHSFLCKLGNVSHVWILYCSLSVSSFFSMNHMFQSAPVEGLNVRNEPGWARLTHVRKCNVEESDLFQRVGSLQFSDSIRLNCVSKTCSKMKCMLNFTSVCSIPYFFYVLNYLLYFSFFNLRFLSAQCCHLSNAFSFRQKVVLSPSCRCSWKVRS